MIPMTIDQDLIDRLVDGEANEDERRRVLSALAHDSELCRRVALAFLEAQEWRRLFPSLAGDSSSKHGAFANSRSEVISRTPSSPAERDITEIQGRPARKSPGRYLGALAAMACSFAVMFAAVWWVVQPRPTKSAAVPPAGTGVATSAQTGGSGELLAENSANPPRVSDAQKPSAPPFQMVAVPVAVGNDGTLTTVDVPIIPVAEGQRPNLWPESVVPAEVLDVLRKSGHVIRQKRQLVPVSLPDGRQTIIPVDQVEIQMPDHDVR